MDIKDIIKWSIKHWSWFVVSVTACVVLGGLYWFFKAPTFNVEAVLMLRQSDQESNAQDNMVQMMGFGGSKIANDEVKVLTSRDMIGRVVDQLGLCTTYSQRGKRYRTECFPNHPMTVLLSEEQLDPVRVVLKVRSKDYKVVVKRGWKSQRLTVKTLDEPISTFMGDMLIATNDSLLEGTYRADIWPRIAAIDILLKQLSINRLSRESNVITLSMHSKCPKKAIAIINTLLDFYNQESASDKNRLAVQTEQFLSARIQVVAAELNQTEATLESFKRNQQIADLNRSAAAYQQSGEAYEQQINDLDAQIQVLDFVSQKLPAYEKAYEQIPGNMGLTDPTVSQLINEYNSLVARRNALLQTATDKNAVVQLVTEQIDQKKQNIHTSIDQLRNTWDRKRKFIKTQQDKYDSRLASIPETERRYLELQRSKQAMEKQYVYLIEKREENALLLASDAVPAKIVDRAQLDPSSRSPQIKKVIVAAFLLGLILPLCLLVIERLRKEIL